jgi:hypothetical protein
MAMIRVLENTFYYLDNFQQVLHWIASRYDDLLDHDERTFLATFPALPRPSRRWPNWAGSMPRRR